MMALTSVKDNVQSVMTAMEAAGYKWTDEPFSFDQEPSSTLNKHYRLNVGTGRIDEESGGRVMKTKAIEIWTAHRLIAAGAKQAAFLNIIAEQDTVEDAIWNSIAALPVSIDNGGMEALYGQNFVICHFTGNLVFWRDI